MAPICSFCSRNTLESKQRSNHRMTGSTRRPIGRLPAESQPSPARVRPAAEAGYSSLRNRNLEMSDRALGGPGSTFQASNMYARPAVSAWPAALTMAVVPEMATEEPKRSPATVSDPFSSAACVQPDTVFVNTYARPACLA